MKENKTDYFIVNKPLNTGVQFVLVRNV